MKEMTLKPAGEMLLEFRCARRIGHAFGPDISYCSAMKPRRRILLCSGTVVIFALVALLVWPGENEPQYQGHKLSWWLEQNKGGSTVEAVKEIGTNGLPFLVGWIRYEPPAWHNDLVRATRRLSPQASHWFYEKTGAKLNRQQNAVWAFAILGAQAAPAIPELLELVRNSNGNTRIATAALFALADIGDAAVPIVLDVLTNAPAYPRIDPRNLGGVLEGPITNKAPLVPVLISCLRSTNRQMAGNAVTMLGSLHTEHATTVPALISLLRDVDDPVLQYRTIAALERFGPEARPAIPQLTQLHHSKNERLRIAADHALNRIAPEVFTNGVLEAKE